MHWLMEMGRIAAAALALLATVSLGTAPVAAQSMDLVVVYDDATDSADVTWYPAHPGRADDYEVRLFDEQGALARSITVPASERAVLIEQVMSGGFFEVEVQARSLVGRAVEVTPREALVPATFFQPDLGAPHRLGRMREPALHQRVGRALDMSLVTCDSGNFPDIYLTVRVEEDGLPVDDLMAEHFSVTEDGRLQTNLFDVTPPASGGGVRLADVVFLIDTSGSMGGEIAAVRDNAINFANALAASGIDYRLGLVQFGQSANSGNPRIIGGGLTDNAQTFTGWVAGLGASGSTEPGFAAIRLAIQQFNFRPGAQKVFLLITDEDSDDRNKQATIDLILANNVTVHAAVRCSHGSSQSDYCNASSVRGVSGGLLFPVQGPYDDVLPTIVENVANSYIVQYRTDNPALDGVERAVVCTVTRDASSDTVECTYIPGGAPDIERTPETIALHTEALVAGSSPTIAVTIKDAVAPFVQGATLHVRTTGGDTYTVVDMAFQGGFLYTAQVPGNLVTSPGVDYFVRATDGQVTSSEPGSSPESNPYQIAVTPNIAPVVVHTPPPTWPEGQALPLTIQVLDDTYGVAELRVKHRALGDLLWITEGMSFNVPAPTEVLETITISAQGVQAPAIEYYIEAVDDLGVTTLWPPGGADHPHVLTVSAVEYLWQSVVIPDVDNPSDATCYDVYVVANEAPTSPETTVFPTHPVDPDLEPIRIIVRDEDGQDVTDEDTLRKTVALARNAALFRSWAAGGSDPVPVLSRLGGFTTVPVTPAKCWFFDLVCLEGGTDTSFGRDYPGPLRIPDDYEGIQGSSRLVDWDVLHFLLSWFFGEDYIHPTGLWSHDQRVQVYTEALQHMVLQDGVAELENSLLTEILKAVEVLEFGLQGASVADTFGDILDNVYAVDDALRAQAFADAMKNVHFTKSEMVAISSGFAPNNFHGWYRALHGPARTAPGVFKLAGKLGPILSWVNLASDVAEIPGAFLNLHFQSAAMAHHGEDILAALSATLAQLPASEVDPALLEAIENVQVGLGDGLPMLWQQAMEDVLAAQQAIASDVFHMALRTAAAGATGTIAGAPAGAVLFLVDGAISVVELIIGFVVDKLDHEELQQAIVLMSTLEGAWWEEPLEGQVDQLLSGQPPTQGLLHRIGWLLSTRLYDGAFVGARLLEENSTFIIDNIRAWLDEDFAARRAQQRAFGEDMADIMMGRVDYRVNDELKQVTGRPVLEGAYVGFAPPAAVAQLLAKTTATIGSGFEVGFGLASPGYIGVVDPAGRRIGTFVIDGLPQDFNEIRGATYTGPTAEPTEILIPNPLSGEYRITLTGYGDGPYTLSVTRGQGGTVLSIETYQGEFETGQTSDAVVSVAVSQTDIVVGLDQAPSARAAVEGTVTNAVTNEPIADASVRLVGLAGALTDANGGYAFDNLVAGDFAIAVSKSGYRPHRSEIMVLAPGTRLTLDVTLEPTLPPVATLAGDQEGEAGEPMTFDASGSHDPDGQIVTYEWDWNGDGLFDEFSVDPVVQHTWDASYTGYVQLRVKDDEGLYGRAATAVTVAPAAGKLYAYTRTYEANSFLWCLYENDTLLRSFHTACDLVFFGICDQHMYAYRNWVAGGSRYWELYEDDQCVQAFTTSTDAMFGTIENGHLYTYRHWQAGAWQCWELYEDGQRIRSFQTTEQLMLHSISDRHLYLYRHWFGGPWEYWELFEDEQLLRSFHTRERLTLTAVEDGHMYLHRRWLTGPFHNWEVYEDGQLLRAWQTQMPMTLCTIRGGDLYAYRHIIQDGGHVWEVYENGALVESFRTTAQLVFDSIR